MSWRTSSVLKRFIAVTILIMLTVIPLFSVVADSVNDIILPLEKGDAGVGVVIIQTRLEQLGYLHFSATGKYGDMTVSAVKSYQSRNGLPVTGKVGENTVLSMFSEGCVRAPRSPVLSSVFGKGQIASVKHGDLYDWVLTVNEEFKVGDTVTLTDYNTGTEIKVKRTGGENHADIRPLDTQLFQSVFGGSNTWEKRACIVTIGELRIAASVFGNPNSNKEYCLYFSGSTSDISGLPDAEHQAMLLKANGQ